ncbi:hypothetical protein PILCRDRAFT_11194 [Piloderma croceum F 1598]|uniref:F-box domain-containing protein n=1 Tax=Piloderma croceum (strain F 1598) TaxID=765440 RepID=A0A0C3BME9_PILCF|nr:hypothetical protein PILCRDRAFT_11194 [Piloderma croceum F 1598]
MHLKELPLNIALSFSLKQSHYYDDEESDDGWGSNDDDGKYLVVFRALLKALIPHVPRWRRLSIHSSTAKITFGTAMRFLETIQAPCLESFEIDHTGSRSYSPDFAPLKRGAPSLSSVTLHGIGMCVGYPPLKSVKCFDIDTSDSGKSFDMSDLHYILARSSSLTRLTIGGSFDFDDERPVHMRHLLSLKITSRERWNDSTANILFLIKAPNLENLTLEIPYNPSKLTEAIRARPLSQRFPKLKRLELGVSNITVHCQLHHLHDVIPNVTHIHVCPLAGDLSIWKFLDASEGHLYWPKLQSVTHLSKSVERRWDIVSTAISSRAAMGIPISELSIHTSYLNGLADRYQWLRQQVAIKILV